MVETTQMSAGGMIGLAIILAIVLLILPGLVLWIAWLAVILLFVGGLAALFMR
ncbi:hypothetical protein MUP38_02495 [Candidatus Bathyarchaeota archaeon]|nr:hypothetical protein [Candidatus Bathyarchaeota archaeon]